jgi:predicted nucleic acid-binding Zn ribbon protein
MVDIPTTKAFKGLVGDVLNLDTGATFRQPHGAGRDTEVVSFVTDDPDHYCKECKSAICKNCGREMHKRDLDLGQDMNRKALNSTRSEAVSNMNPNEYEEFSTGRFEPLDKLPWFRKCKDSVTCEAYKHSKIEKNSFRIFSARGNPKGKYTYYDSESSNASLYQNKSKQNDPWKAPKQCERCGGDVKKNPTVRNKHQYWGRVCDDCADVLQDSDR